MTDAVDDSEVMLTNEGRQYALTAAEHNSIVARTALTGRGEWPDTHVDAAIRLCNTRGREVKAEAAFLGTYEGPWGIKASEEDALLSILRAVRPEFGPSGSLDIYALRGWDRLDGLVDDLSELMQEGLTSKDIVKAILPEIDRRFA
jgi:hypothetical protein